MPYSIAALGGLLLMFAAAEVSGRREAWDSGIYWLLFYPLSIAACGVLGYLFPLGLLLFGILSLPGMAVAMLGAKFKGRPSDS